MNIVCLDMEGVLVPEIWIAFSEESGIPELRRTTRDEPDYDKLMTWRLGILKEHGLGLKDAQPPGHQFVVVGLVPGGAAQLRDAALLGKGDPDLRDQNALHVQTHNIHR